MFATNIHRLAIVRRGPPARPFGWQIVRESDSAEIARSSETFRSRYEAIADGERALGAWHAGGPVAVGVPGEGGSIPTGSTGS